MLNFSKLAEASEDLYVRSETPLIDGQYGPNYHNPLRLSLSKDGYAKWRAVHWNRHERFETEGMPILPCKRLAPFITYLPRSHRMKHCKTGKRIPA